MIRAITLADLPALKLVIEKNDLFPAEMLDGMTSTYFEHGEGENEFWFTDDEPRPVVVAYCAPERMTHGTWNLYLIAVHPEHQGEGRGTRMLRHIERLLSEKGERILLIETSAFDDFARTRQFYSKNGYTEEARIREFYRAGEDKIIFRKSLLRVHQSSTVESAMPLVQLKARRE